MYFIDRNIEKLTFALKSYNYRFYHKLYSFISSLPGFAFFTES